MKFYEKLAVFLMTGRCVIHYKAVGLSRVASESTESIYMLSARIIATNQALLSQNGITKQQTATKMAVLSLNT